MPPEAGAALVVPPGFKVRVLARNFNDPVSMAFAPDGRLFVVERGGVVHVVMPNGDVLPDPFIDLSAETSSEGDRGLMDVAFHPSFSSNHWVYLLYSVKPPPSGPPQLEIPPTFGRLVRVKADVAQGGNVADLNSREILIGHGPDDGFIHCWASHLVGEIAFANDGSLFVGSGDGAHFENVDAGGFDPQCFSSTLFDPLHDVGAFRVQHLDSLAGKIIRIDSETGQGLSSNPYWTGNADDARSKVWAYGLRQHFRFVVQPGTPSPGRLWIGDVGWHDFEEINISHGGENFGWPCFEGPDPHVGYQNATPSHSGCDTIETPGNPGPLTGPALWLHHKDAALSSPAGLTGRCLLAGEFYTGDRYPPRYHNKLFVARFVGSKLDVLDPALILAPGPAPAAAFENFATGAGKPVTFAKHPDTGDLYYIPNRQHRIHHIEWISPPADVDHDGDVDLTDFGRFQACLSDTVASGCLPFDADADTDVDLGDFEVFLDAVGQY